MDAPKKLLFICSGNVCRSAMAELLWNKMAADKGLQVEARSCGTRADSSIEVPEGIWRVLREMGVPRRAHTPRLVGEDLLSWADAALTMTRDQRESLAGRFPIFASKLAPLRPYAGLADEDIDDPTTDEAAYGPCRDRIHEALTRLLARY